MMSLLENKHLHALASWVILAVIILSVGLPILSLLDASLDSQSRLNGKKEIIASLEQRVVAFRKPAAGENITAKTIEPEKGAATQIVLASCSALAESHAKHGNTITAPCQPSQTPLGNQFTVYMAEIHASGSIENLLVALDDAQLGEGQLTEFDLSTDENSSGGNLGLKFAIIGAATEAPAQ
jgi:hypothetical protein